MSPDLDESGTVPDDRLLVRPYVAPSVQPEGPTALAWPQTGPVSVAAQLATPSAGSEPPAPAPPPLLPRAAPAFASASAVPTGSPSGSPSGPRSGGGRRAEGGSRLPFVALALLALSAAGVLAWLLHEPDEEPPRAVAPPGLSVPVLPARSPGAGEEPTPSAGSAASTRSAGTASAQATTAPPASGTPSGAGRNAKSSAPSGGPQPSSDGSGTLRPGDRGPEVRALQERLYGQGFTYVSLTGVYDEQTRRGVTQLQQDRSIKGDPPGVYGPATRAAFGSGG
ncbi:peptidoglycan-binding protein [Streptomyces sp. NPDC054961]